MFGDGIQGQGDGVVSGHEWAIGDEEELACQH